MAMFRFAAQREVLWPVKFKIPVDGGGHKEFKIKVRYKLLSKSKMRELLRSTATGAEDESPRQALLRSLDEQRMAEYLDDIAEHISGWEELADEEGEPLEFSNDVLRAVLDDAHLGAAIERGLWEVSREAPAKNSKPGSGG